MQNRRNFLIQSTLAAGAITLLKPFKSFAFKSTGGGFSFPNKITILHTANLHGYLQAKDGFGGIRGLTKTLADIRKVNKHVVLVDAGDALDGSIGLSNNNAFLSALSNVGYDAMVPGNREMTNGVKYLDEVAKKGRLTVVATNYFEDRSTYTTILPYQVINKGNIKIGIVSLGNTTKVKAIASSSLAENVRLINKTASFLKQNINCKLVICLSHEAFTQKNCNLSDDIALAESSCNIDIIISGTHVDEIYKSRLVKNIKAEDVIVSTSGAYGSSIGQIEITFDEQREKVAINCNQVFICSEPNQQAAFKKYAHKLSVA